MALNLYKPPIWLSNKVDLINLSEELKHIAVNNFNNTQIETELSKQLIALKLRLEAFQTQDIHLAHKKINPFENVGNLLFQNRAAVKLLSINADIGHLLNRDNFELKEDDIFYFADLCGGNDFDLKKKKILIYYFFSRSWWFCRIFIICKYSPR